MTRTPGKRQYRTAPYECRVNPTHGMTTCGGEGKKNSTAAAIKPTEEEKGTGSGVAPQRPD